MSTSITYWKEKHRICGVKRKHVRSPTLGMNTSWFEEATNFENYLLPILNNTYSRNSKDSMYDDDDQLYEVPTGIIVLLSIFYGTISLLAVMGNSLVMWIIATSRRMQSVTNCFIANLAFADIVIGLFAIPFQFQAALLQRWNLPHFMCAFCPFVQVLSVNVSVFTLTAIAVDRHRAILKPLSARPSKLKARMIIAGIWIVGGSLATPIAVAYRVIKIPDRTSAGRLYTRPFCHNENLSEGLMLTYRALLGFLQYLTPLVIISFVYARMALRLWGNRAPGNAEDSRDANLMKNKKKVIKMLVIVVALFGICWLPLQTYNVLQYTYPQINEYRYINIIWFCCDWLAMSNSCYNPFIYGIYNEKFKREFQQRCPLKTPTWSGPPTESLETNATLSTRPSVRNDYRRAGTDNPAVTSFCRGTSMRESSARLCVEEGGSNAKNKYTGGCYIRNNQNRRTMPRTSKKSTGFYVFPLGKHKVEKDITAEEII